MIQSIFVGHGAPTIIWEENEFTNCSRVFSSMEICALICGSLYSP